MSIDISEKFPHEGPDQIGELMASWIPVFPKKRSSTEQTLLCVDPTSRAMCTVCKGVQTSAWFFDDMESFAGSDDPLYMRFEFRKDPTKEFSAAQPSDNQIYQQLMCKVLRFDSLPSEQFRDVIHAETVEMTAPVKGKRFLVLVAGRLFRLERPDSKMPEAVHCLLNADIWADASQGTVNVEEQVGQKAKIQFRVKDAEAWKRALVISGSLARKSAMEFNSKQEIRRAAVLNQEVFFTFAACLGHGSTYNPQAAIVLHFTFDDEKLNMEKGEAVMVAHELSSIEDVEREESRVTISLRKGEQKTSLRVQLQTEMDANLLYSVAAVEAEKNKKEHRNFFANLQFGSEKLNAILRVDRRERRLQIMDADGKISHTWKLQHVVKVSKSKGNDCVLTVLVQTNPTDPKTKIIMNAELQTGDERNLAHDLLQDAYIENLEVPTFLNESVRIIRKSGHITLTGTCAPADTKKDSAKRFLMVTPSKLFVFRDSKGVRTAMNAISLKDLRCVVTGREVFVTFPGDIVAIHFITDTLENAADWGRILHLEAQRKMLPDPAKPRERIQNDDEVVSGVVPEPEPEQISATEAMMIASSAAQLSESEAAGPVTPAEETEAEEKVAAVTRMTEGLELPEDVGNNIAAAAAAAEGEEGGAAAVEGEESKEEGGGGGGGGDDGSSCCSGGSDNQVIVEEEGESEVEVCEEGEEEDGEYVYEDVETEVEVPGSQTVNAEGVTTVETVKKMVRVRRKIEPGVDKDELGKKAILDKKSSLVRIEAPAEKPRQRTVSVAVEDGQNYQFSQLLTWFATKEQGPAGAAGGAAAAAPVEKRKKSFFSMK